MALFRQVRRRLTDAKEARAAGLSPVAYPLTMRAGAHRPGLAIIALIAIGSINCLGLTTHPGPVRRLWTPIQRHGASYRPGSRSAEWDAGNGIPGTGAATGGLWAKRQPSSSPLAIPDQRRGPSQRMVGGGTSSSPDGRTIDASIIDGCRLSVAGEMRRLLPTTMWRRWAGSFPVSRRGRKLVVADGVSQHGWGHRAPLPGSGIRVCARNAVPV